MRYFIDLEFQERGPQYSIKPISVGIVADDGREFYAVVKGFGWGEASKWLKDNVGEHLPAPAGYGSALVETPAAIAVAIDNFIGNDDHPEFWGYYSDYDWVVFCQLWGDMSAKPEKFPFRCNDLYQLYQDTGALPLSQDESDHNALSDARWIRFMWEHYWREYDPAP